MKSNRKKNPTKSKSSSQFQTNSNTEPLFSNYPINLYSDLEPNFSQYPNYGSQNLSITNSCTFTQFPPRPPQNPTFSQVDFPSQNPTFSHSQFSQDKPVFPMSQHFSTPQDGDAFPSFDCSYKTTAASDDDDDEVEAEDVEQVEDNQRAQEGSRFWSKGEQEVLVKAWLEVSQNKKTNTNQKGEVFWGKIEKMFDNVRQYKLKYFEEGVEGVTQADLLKVRGLEQLRSRWRRINASCSKFCGSHASAVARRKSGESDDDVLNAAYKIYEADKTKTKLMSKTFQDKHVWDILIKHVAWKPTEDIVGKCKQKTSTQGSDSKRSRINEAGNYSSSTNPETPTSDSGDIGCSVFPSSDESNKNKSKSKMAMVPSGAWQQWLDTVQNMNQKRQSETEMELTRLKYKREKEIDFLQVEREKTQLEREREARKQRKINMELFKHLDLKSCLSDADQELRNNLLKKLYPSD